MELVARNAGLAAPLYARSASWTEFHFSPTILFFAFTATLVIQFGLWSVGLYSLQVVYSGQRVVASLAGAFVFLSAALFPVCYLFTLTRDAVFGVTLKFYVFLLAVFLVGVERFLVLKLFQGSYLGNVLVLGTGACICEVIREAPWHDDAACRNLG
jgi:FlaA1/EpsC-like NDP-sugar epimerase